MENHGSSFVNGRRVSLRLKGANQKEARLGQGQLPTKQQRVSRQPPDASNADHAPGAMPPVPSFTDVGIKQEEVEEEKPEIADEEKPEIDDQVKIKTESDDEGGFALGLPPTSYANGIKKEEEDEDVKDVKPH